MTMTVMETTKTATVYKLKVGVDELKRKGGIVSLQVPHFVGTYVGLLACCKMFQLPSQIIMVGS